MNPRPVIGITMGDPAGIGPELGLRALREPSVIIECVPVLFGDKGVFARVTSSYHDQGHIPFKMLAFDTGVNITLGLPIIRTSVDHGTAFDIAWKGVANPQSLFAAIRVAVELARGRKTAGASA